MIDYSYLIQKVMDWADERKISAPENLTKQALKLGEEYGELIEAVLKKKPDQFKDSIGDMQVVMIILCQQYGVDYEQCLRDAYQVIENRKGKTENGVFIKEADM